MSDNTQNRPEPEEFTLTLPHNFLEQVGAQRSNGLNQQGPGGLAFDLTDIVAGRADNLPCEKITQTGVKVRLVVSEEYENPFKP